MLDNTLYNNIALIGFKSCGKSTIAKSYASRFGYNYIDTDRLLIESLRVSNIVEAYNTLGGLKFRQAEAYVIKDISNSISFNDSNIIATGGGVILDDQNIVNLKKKAKIIYINTPIDIIIERLLSDKQTVLFRHVNSDDDMSHKTAAIIEKYQHRLSKYISASDYIIETGSKNPQQIVDELAAVVNAKAIGEQRSC